MDAQVDGARTPSSRHGLRLTVQIHWVVNLFRSGCDAEGRRFVCNGMSVVCSWKGMP